MWLGWRRTGFPRGQEDEQRRRREEAGNRQLEDTTAKPFECEICHRHFRRRQDIARHRCVTTRPKGQVSRPLIWHHVFDQVWSATRQRSITLWGGFFFKVQGVCVCVCVCVWGGGGGGGLLTPFFHLSIQITKRRAKDYVALWPLPTHGKKDNELYPSSPRVLNFWLFDLDVHYIVCFRFIWRHAQYLLSYISGCMLLSWCVSR